MRWPLVILLFSCHVGDVLAKTQRPLPRFVSTRFTEANFRVGPGNTYPVIWVFTKKNIPVEITVEFGNWRRVRDFEGVEGWFHKSMLKSERYGIVEKDLTLLHKSHSSKSRGLFRLARGLRVRIKSCRKSWCEISVQDHSGWVRGKDLWGVYDGEKVG